MTPNERPWDWECDPDKHCPYCTPRMDQRDVDLEFCKVWASNFPKDYRANYRKGLA